MQTPPRHIGYRLATWFGVVCISAVHASAQRPDRQQSDAPFTASAVRHARARSNTAIAQRDTAALVEMVSPSYHSVSSRNAHTSGRDGVLTQWRRQFTTYPDVAFTRTPLTIQLFAPWQMAEERGGWVGRWTESDGRVEIRGTYVAKWRRVNGRWLLEAEIFTPRACSGSAYCTRPPEP